LHFVQNEKQVRASSKKQTPLFLANATSDDPPGFFNTDCAGIAFMTEPLPDHDMAPPRYIRVPGPAEAGMENHMIPAVQMAELLLDGIPTWIYGVRTRENITVSSNP
jgi:hypothetical protein